MTDAIHFECPRCKATHDRGYVGYVGHGFHPDEEIDAGIGRDIRKAQKCNRDLGLPEGPFEP